MFRRRATSALSLRTDGRYVRDNLLPQVRRRTGRAHLTTVPYRGHRMSAMVAPPREAFGIEFREVDTGGGLRSRFGEVDGLTLKFVPIRDTVDFEGLPVHQQLGLEVPDMEAVLAAGLHAAARDPDGNTLELYGGR